MTLTIVRRFFDGQSTIGELLVDGRFFCYTLEDRDRRLSRHMPLAAIQAAKVPGQTAIPTGLYKVRFTFSPRFQRKTLQIMDVPGFEGVRIHAGNTADDTAGCILPGDYKSPGRLTNSRKRVRELESLLHSTHAEEWELRILD